jgi:cobalt/nickel transport system permease protein
MMALTLGVARTPVRVYLRLLLVPILFLSTGLIAVAFSVTVDPPPEGNWVELWGVSLGSTEAGLATARDIFWRVLGSVSCLYFLILSTPMVDIIGLLRRLRVPVLFLEVMALVYRFMFVLSETALAIRQAQALRLGYVTFGATYRSLAGLAANLLLRAYKRAHVLHIALLVRGYDGQLDVLEAPRRLSPGNLLLSVVVGTGLLLLAIVTPEVG